MNTDSAAAVAAPAATAAAAPAASPQPAPSSSPAASPSASPSPSPMATGDAVPAADAAAPAAPSPLDALLSSADRQLLYALVVRQLQDDGLVPLSQAVAQATRAPLGQASRLPPNQLAALVTSALAQLQRVEDSERRGMVLSRAETIAAKADTAQDVADAAAATGADSSMDTSDPVPFSVLGASPALLDLSQRGPHASAQSAPFPPYVPRYVSTQADSVTAASFSPDGTLVATAARDGSVRLMDVARMKLGATVRSGADVNAGGRVRMKDPAAKAASALKPQLHRWTDFDGPCTTVAFHPFEQFILAASRDASIKFFNYGPVMERVAAGESGDRDLAARKAHKLLCVETAPVNSVCFHPSGDFALVATDANVCRLFDVRTFGAYCSPDFAQFHGGSILSARFHPSSGATYVTASIDGSVKVWDGASGACVRSIVGSHGGAAVTAVEYSPSGQYLLSTGLDSTARLWEAASGRLVHTYRGASHRTPLRAAFDYSGEFVLSGDEGTPGLAVWDTRTAELVRRVEGHSGVIRSVAASGVEDAFVTCADDHRAMFWSV